MAQMTWFRPTTVLFGVRTMINIFGGLCPPKGREYAFSSQSHKILKLAYYRNYCIDSNQILHSDKDHQTSFVGGPITHITNPRWRTAAILEKSKNRHVSSTIRRFRPNLARRSSSTLLSRPTFKNLKF